MADPFTDPFINVPCDPDFETCPEDFAPGLTCDPDFEDCPEPVEQADPEPTSGEGDINPEDENNMEENPTEWEKLAVMADSSQLVQLVTLYYGQFVILPLIALIMLGQNNHIVLSWWFWIMETFHGLAYIPTALLGTMYLIFGKEQSDFTLFLDDTLIWLIVYATANLGLATHSIGFLLYTIYLIVEIDQWSYWMLWVLYLGYAAYTNYYQIVNGVGIIRYIQPLWRGTPSGLLFPWLMYVLGLVDEEGRAKFFDDESTDDDIVYDGRAGI